MSLPSPFSIREIGFDSPLYHESLRARDRILRQPLGLRLSGKDTQGEARQRHFALVAREQLLGGLIAGSAGPATARLRQMWIEPDHQDRGLGRRLLAAVVQILVDEGAETVLLHAREPVVGFYESCGFAVEGGAFTEVGIPHLRMVRRFNPERRSPDCHR